MPTSPRMPWQRRGIKLKGHSAPRRGVLLPSAAKVPKNAVQTCGLKIPCAPSPAAYPACFHHANAVQISPKCCIVSAPLFAAAFALKCRAVHPRGLWQDCFFKWRPKAATYLCRFAAKARFDNRSPLGRVSKGEGRSPPFWSFQGDWIFKERGKSKSPFP